MTGGQPQEPSGDGSPNGAGKSTLLNLACGQSKPTIGTIRVLGHQPGDGPGQLARVGFVAQDTPVYAGLSVADHLCFGARTPSHADGITHNGSSLVVGGISLPDAWVVSTGHALDPAGQPPSAEKVDACLMPGRFDGTVACLAGQDLHVTATYQPNTRYWPFQLIETTLYTVLAAALSGFCFFWIRRRTT
ncbi:ATP-binding cassette domain-containing protein [Kitasatospora sp. NPDC056783]|uniref:ATP-binding cassette domain-containing protein n=1 Tax=Kitasatospora sp. NPDC056783 TaxID=3345943 RepID=UPI003675611F